MVHMRSNYTRSTAITKEARPSGRCTYGRRAHVSELKDVVGMARLDRGEEGTISDPGLRDSHRYSRIVRIDTALAIAALWAAQLQRFALPIMTASATERYIAWRVKRWPGAGRGHVCRGWRR